MFKKKYKNKDFDPKFNINLKPRRILWENEKAKRKMLRKENGGDFFATWMEKGYNYDPWIWFYIFVFVIAIYGGVSLILDLWRLL